MNTIPEETLAHWSRLIASLKPPVGFWITRYDEPVDDTVYPTSEAAWDVIEGTTGTDVAPVSVQLTIGYSPAVAETSVQDARDASWGWQSGDNSFTGGAYSHPFWGVTWLTADSVPDDVAKELASEIADQLAEQAA